MPWHVIGARTVRHRCEQSCPRDRWSVMKLMVVALGHPVHNPRVRTQAQPGLLAGGWWKGRSRNEVAGPWKRQKSSCPVAAQCTCERLPTGPSDPLSPTPRLAATFLGGAEGLTRQGQVFSTAAQFNSSLIL